MTKPVLSNGAVHAFFESKHQIADLVGIIWVEPPPHKMDELMRIMDSIADVVNAGSSANIVIVIPQGQGSQHLDVFFKVGICYRRPP